MKSNKKILFAVLNWGLGHATRSIPVIDVLVKNGFEVILASDGEALQLLRLTFPKLAFETLPAYKIKYAKTSFLFSPYLAWQTPKIIQKIHLEKKQTLQIVDKYQIDLIISDNRFGVFSKHIPSVYITHQLRVLSGWTTWFTGKIHQNIYQKYNQIWVPDFKGSPNLSGQLGHLSKPNPKIKYIGVLSRMKPEKLEKKYDILAILSGPEPQRSIFEKILLNRLSKRTEKIALVQGKIATQKSITKYKNIDIYNYLLSADLQKLINRSEVIVSRSGYTSVMDYYGLQKKVLWVPTPGQKEQEYLAKYLETNYGASITNQQNFTLKIPKLPTKFEIEKKDNIIDLIRKL